MTAVPLLNTVSLPEFTDLVERVFLAGPELLPYRAGELFMIEPVPANTGEKRRYDEIDGEQFASHKPQGADAEVASVAKGYSKDMEVRRFAREINVTYEMRQFNKYQAVVSELLTLATFVRNRMELDMTHRFTFVTATSYTDRDGETIDLTGGDGLAIVASAHTLTASSTTWSNVITGNPIFSAAALNVAREVGNKNCFTHFGEQKNMEFNTIITSRDPDTVDEVQKVLKSQSDIDQNNPGVVNVYAGRYRHTELPYLDSDANGAPDDTKSKAWGLASIGMGAKNSLQAYVGVWEAPRMKPTFEDPHNDNWTYGTRGSYGICIVSGRGLLWSDGTGA